MGKITVFTTDDCPFCKKAKDLLGEKNAPYNEISLTQHPEWRGHMFILTKGRRTVPEVFFNDQLIGGWEHLEKLEQRGRLAEKIRECLEAPAPENFPPTLKKPTGDELVLVLPEKLRQRWHGILEDTNKKFIELLGKPIANLMVVMDTPDELVVPCSAGPSADVFPVGVSGPPGVQEKQDMSWCQVALGTSNTVYIDDTGKIPGCAKNIDVQLGYRYYLGAPWFAEQMKGTVVALEKEDGLLKEEHKPIIEGVRDTFQKDLREYLASLGLEPL